MYNTMFIKHYLYYLKIGKGPAAPEPPSAAAHDDYHQNKLTPAAAIAPNPASAPTY